MYLREHFILYQHLFIQNVANIKFKLKHNLPPINTYTKSCISIYNFQNLVTLVIKKIIRL